MINAAPPLTSTFQSTVTSGSFLTLGIDEHTNNDLKRQGWNHPTPIQEQAIPFGLQGRDLIGIAQTGTGKTLAFALPILHRLRKDKSMALVVAPTRELALQIDETFRKLSSRGSAKIRSVVLIGGASMHRQKQDMAGARVIIATPGRLQDHFERRNIHFKNVSVVVLDEADRMFDMGFAPQVKKILSVLPKTRQTLLFSATMPPAIEGLVKSYLQDPARIQVTPPGSSVKETRQELCYVAVADKTAVLEKLLKESGGIAIVFARTRFGAKGLTRKVKAMGYSAAELHSDRSLGQRRQALDGFKTGKYDVLIATDIAARGIDVEDVKLVVNYDLPNVPEDYVHRIGRTGRAGRTGLAISLATFDQLKDVQAIERLTGVKFDISPHSLPVPRPVSNQSRGSRRTSRRW